MRSVVVIGLLVLLAASVIIGVFSFISSLRVVPLLRAWSVRANVHLGSYIAPMLNVDGNRTGAGRFLGTKTF